MGTCAICTLNAGFFKSEHPECREKFDAAYARLKNIPRTALAGGAIPDDLMAQANEIARAGLVSPEERRSALVTGWEQSVEAALSDEVLTEDEEHSLVHLGSSLGLSQTDLDLNGAYSRLTQGAVLRDLEEGKLPSRMNVVGPQPFNLQKGETMVWVFPNTTLYEVRAHRSFEGSSQGVSVRITRGVYYRVGAFKGHPVETVATELADVGTLGLSDRGLYFAGTKKGIHVPYKKITTLTPYSDGFGIQRDAVSARPQAFVVPDKDSWFVFNLVTNLARLDAAAAPPARTRRSSPATPSDGSPAELKQCPDCAEMVRAEARICRFCRHAFTDGPVTPGS